MGFRVTQWFNLGPTRRRLGSKVFPHYWMARLWAWAHTGDGHVTGTYSCEIGPEDPGQLLRALKAPWAQKLAEHEKEQEARDAELQITQDHMALLDLWSISMNIEEPKDALRIVFTTPDFEAEVNAIQAAAFDTLSKNLTELKADITEVITKALSKARGLGEEDHMGNYTNQFHKAHAVEVVDGAILVEWTDDGERYERFSIEIGTV